MFKNLLILSLVIFALSRPLTEQEALNELKSSGMSEYGVNTLIQLDNEFKIEYPKVAGTKESVAKFMADFAVKAQSVVDSMRPEDQMVYNNYVKKYSQE